jgi:S1-C subfamily serine protease
MACLAVNPGAIGAEPETTPAAKPAPPTPATASTNTVENSVVKVFSTIRFPDHFKPWTKRAPMQVTGSGVVIRGKRILSNAHVVLYASQVQVQANQAGDKISATVEALAPDVDLAVLKLDDESFFDTHPPLARATALPDVRDSVMVYGYPEGGSSLSVTKGIVSRIEFVPSAFRAGILWIQIDAAVNPGNSGGPAVAADKMIGLTFSRLDGADNIGYIIPNEEVDLFLKDIADGRYDGKPGMFEELQTLENPALRSFLKLDKSVEGIVVHRPADTSTNYPLHEWDVITRIGDLPIDVEGDIKAGPNLRVRFQYMIQKLGTNGIVPLTVVRAGKEIHLDLPVTARRPSIMPSLEGTYPSYFIYGPLVFSSASLEFIAALRKGELSQHVLGQLGAGGSPLLKRVGEPPAFPGENLVVVSSPLFPHKLAKGYSNPVAQVVQWVNGTRIRNLQHLVTVLRDAKGDFVTFDFDLRGFETFVFPRREMVAATDEILNDNGIRSQGSPDTMAIWNAKGKH